MLLEVCVDSVAGFEAAVAGGADRIELCADLGCGGLTPSAGMMKVAAGCGVPVHALIRPRPGDFRYGPQEVAVMCADIVFARLSGLQGVVIGAAGPDGGLDRAVLRQLINAAEGMSLTLSRVFDLVPERAEALEQAVGLGFSRILTSGCARTASEGIVEIADLIDRAAGRIVILPGSGISAANARHFIQIGATELHSSCSTPFEVDARLARFGFSGSDRRRTDQALVRALKGVMHA